MLLVFAQRLGDITGQFRVVEIAPPLARHPSANTDEMLAGRVFVGGRRWNFGTAIIRPDRRE